MNHQHATLRMGEYNHAENYSQDGSSSSVAGTDRRDHRASKSGHGCKKLLLALSYDGLSDQVVVRRVSQ